VKRNQDYLSAEKKEENVQKSYVNLNNRHYLSQKRLNDNKSDSGLVENIGLLTKKYLNKPSRLGSQNRNLKGKIEESEILDQEPNHREVSDRIRANVFKSQPESVKISSVLEDSTRQKQSGFLEFDDNSRFNRELEREMEENVVDQEEFSRLMQNESIEENSKENVGSFGDNIVKQERMPTNQTNTESFLLDSQQKMTETQEARFEQPNDETLSHFEKRQIQLDHLSAELDRFDETFKDMDDDEY
jgi:hypothetical protein